MIFWIMFWLTGCQPEVEAPTPPIALPLQPSVKTTVFSLLEGAEDIRILLVNDQSKGFEIIASQLTSHFEALQSERGFEKLAVRGIQITSSFSDQVDLSETRMRFSKLSEVLITLGSLDDDFQAGHVVFECPMVDFFPKWIQPVGEMANPYMGQAMLVCGVESDWTGSEGLLGSVEPSDIAYFTCPMHPDVKKQEEGTCPICNMDLVPVSSNELESGTVIIDGMRRQKTAISSEPVAFGQVTPNLSYFGTVLPDARYVHRISLRFDGWIEESNALRIGQKVKKGATLFKIYSPEVFTAQQEFLIRSGHQESARRKLSLLGISDRWIQRLSETNSASTTVPIVAPADGVLIETSASLGAAVSAGQSVVTLADTQHLWLDVEVFSSQALSIELGAEVVLELDGLVHPAVLLDRLPSRSAGQVETYRFAFNAPEDHAFQLEQTVNTVIVQDQPNVLRVPAGAVITTGKRHIVFVDIGSDRLQPRDIQIGTRNPEWVEVLTGLDEGERVVSKGVFLVASESRIQSATTFWAGAEDEDQP